MGFHTFSLERADSLDDPARYRFCSREELLELLDPEPTDHVMDIGSGTGFFTADVAPFVGALAAVDVQSGMHRHFAREGIPANTQPVTCGISALPFVDDAFDHAFSVDTHHEYYSDVAMSELARTIRPSGRLVTIDWAANGSGEAGPPLEERYTPAEIVTHLESAGFEIAQRRERPETVAITAVRNPS